MFKSLILHKDLKEQLEYFSTKTRVIYNSIYDGQFKPFRATVA